MQTKQRKKTQHQSKNGRNEKQQQQFAIPWNKKIIEFAAIIRFATV